MIVEYALAQLWMSWGIQPTALAGHSMGENTAACVAGVMSFEDCIGSGASARARCLTPCLRAGCCRWRCLPTSWSRLLGDDLDLGAVNAPELSVASGPQGRSMRLQARLKADDIDCQRIAHRHRRARRMLDADP